MSWPAMQAFVASANFSEFVRHQKFLADNGAQPQITSLTDASGGMIVDWICRFETLAADFSEVTTHLGLQEAVLKRSTSLRPAKCALTSATMTSPICWSFTRRIIRRLATPESLSGLMNLFQPIQPLSHPFCWN